MKMELFSPALVAVMVLSLVAVAPAQEKKPAALALTGVRLIDGNGGRPLDDAVIIIQGDTFAAVGPKDQVTVPKDAEIIDLKGKTVIPGLIDAHIHFTSPAKVAPGVKFNPAYSAFWSADFLRKYLMVGVTTVRDVAGVDTVPVAARQAFEAGIMVGSRPVVCGQGITSTGGHGTEGGSDIGVQQVDGADGFRMAVRTQIKAGADILKILCPFSRDEIMAAVEEAHLHEKFITVHPSLFKAQYDFLRWTVEAGADCFEHAYAVPDDVIPQVATKNMYCVPTLSILLILGDQYEKLGPDWAWKVKKYRDCDEIFKKLKQAGVRMAVGTDAIGGNISFYPDIYFMETERFVRDGYTPLETITAATRMGAAVCDAAARLGTIEAGKIADLLVLDKDPLADIRNLRTASIIIQGGKIVKR